MRMVLALTFGALCLLGEAEASNFINISRPKGRVPPGTSVIDTISGGTLNAGPAIFFLCQPSEVVLGQGCVAGGKQIGGPKGLAVSIGEGISRGGSDPASGSDTATLGTYCWRAEV